MGPRLLQAAKAARRRAHAPYSKFKVGAAILADDGKVYAGCNVENAAYPEGVCAETSAISAMVLAGGRRIKEILVIGSAAEVTPCGGCRQRIREFSDPDTRIHLCAGGKRVASLGLEELLPRSFGPTSLGRRK